MIVAITGGTGFVGGELALRHLEMGDEVRILSRDNPNEFFSKHPVEWYKLGNDFESLARFLNNVDVLYHCAGETFEVSRMQSTNVEFTKKLIEAASGRISRWVQLSTVSVYGSGLTGQVNETSPCNAVEEYAKTKLAADVHVETAGKRGAFEYVLLRPSMVFGERMHSQALYRLFSIINNGLFFFIGHGALINCIHVSNLVAALMLVGKSQHASGQTYIISDFQTMEAFATTICDALNVKKPRVRLPEGLCRAMVNIVNILPMVNINSAVIDTLTSKCYYDDGKISNDLGYQKLLEMGEGLASIVLHWKCKKIKNKK